MRRAVVTALSLIAVGVLFASPFSPFRKAMGPQPDGTFLVSSGQTVLPGTVAFDQRLSDLALNPKDGLVAVVAKNKVFLVEGKGMVAGSDVALGANAGFHGVLWSHGGDRLYVSTDAGHVQVFDYSDKRLKAAQKIVLKKEGEKTNPVPGGMCLNGDGSRLYVACTNLGSAAEVDTSTGKVLRYLEAQRLPFTVRLSPDESTLIVSNWGGEPPDEDDEKDLSQDLELKVTHEGSTATGTVSIVDLKTGGTSPVYVGFHPTGLAVAGDLVYVANAMSDSISVVDWKKRKVVKTIELRFNGKKVIGSMPNELAYRDGTLYACNGGDNALCVIDPATGRVKGYHPAGYYPTGVQLTSDGRTAYVVNTKGNGSVKNSVKGAKARNAHDFQGTVSVVDLGADLKVQSAKVAELNAWNTPADLYKPKMKVYQGGIKHVIYIIKENRTYDEIYGDMPEGNGDPSLCSIGESAMPNHRKLARTFGLFDNAYVCGTNSADGHQWANQAGANEYLEHFYVGYSRTYPDDGEDAMALNSTGRIWDAAMKAGKTVRVYGEWAGDDQALYEPRKPKDWFEAWEDRETGRNEFKYKAHTRVPSLKAVLCPDYHYWPLIQSDQSRVDVFEREFRSFEAQGKVPNLIVMSLPSDHTEGTSKAYPTPRSMMADNDLALGRIVDIVSHSKVWKETCIFVTEDDAQAGPDHVDGHRTSTLVMSPYSKRGVVNSGFLTQVNILRSIEEMLGFKPMTKFDTIATPVTECFVERPDLTPYTVAKNNVPLGERNPDKEMTAMDKYWHDKTMSLDWSGLDRADFYWLNRIVWYSIHKGKRPYPDRPWDEPGRVDTD
ncbi:MAG: bifunctional YncE family protein/alkaline phosphatase family protein [Armatimonadetes bacterium]|nr:bifunctional YncE family protein/alkaline phosphatase family protein [Armatimonadota bacterium]